MYEKIQSKECLNQGWNGKKKYQRSPNISNVIDFTNQVLSPCFVSFFLLTK